MAVAFQTEKSVGLFQSVGKIFSNW